MLPTMSIVTIAFNDLKGLRKTRKSVETQTSVGVKHIIVDGGSQDGTLEFLKSLHGVDWSSESDKGRYDAMNRGISRADTDLIWLMHAGDTFGDEFSVAKVVRSYSEERWSWALGFSRITNSDGEMIGYSGSVPFDIRRFALGGKTIPHQAAIFERRLYEDMGGYNEEFGLAADQLYMLRLAKRSPPQVIGEFLCNFNSGGAGSTRGIRPHFADMSRARRLASYSVTGSYLVDWAISKGMLLGILIKDRIPDLLT